MLSAKHGKWHPELAKRKHRKYLRNGMEGSPVKEFCHKIERKFLNILRDILIIQLNLMNLLIIIITQLY